MDLREDVWSATERMRNPLGATLPPAPTIPCPRIIIVDDIKRTPMQHDSFDIVGVGVGGLNGAEEVSAALVHRC